MRCLICGSDDSEFITRWEEWSFEKCQRCGVFFTAAAPENEVVSRYVTGSLLDERPNDGAPTQELTFPAWKHDEHASILNGLVALGAPRGRLLDVGCLWGSFLKAAHEKGFDVVGVEPFGKAVTYVNRVLNLPAVQGTLRSAEFSAESFDVVTFFDVIEHLPDPVVELKEAYRVTKPGGLLVLNTPDVGSFIPWLTRTKRRLLGQQWAAFDAPPWHLWGFTKESISKCVENGGFRVESVRWMESSLKTTNQHPGGALWKRAAFSGLGAVCSALGISDRILVFALKGPVLSSQG